MSKRTRAREVAVQMLYQVDVNPTADPVVVREQVERQLPQPDLSKLAMLLYLGTRERLESVDAFIAEAAENWSVSRMSVVDRSVIRLAVFEMKFFDTPPKVAINEALEVTRRFSGSQSVAFVNGVLDRVMNGPRPGTPLPTPGPVLTPADLPPGARVEQPARDGGPPSGEEHG